MATGWSGGRPANATDPRCPALPGSVAVNPASATAAAFWTRAYAWFTAAGITVERVLTDNGSCYRSRLWKDTFTNAGITHKRTRPYRPQTNGKVERFNRTMLDEWAYATTYHTETERRAAFPAWLHIYNLAPEFSAWSGQGDAQSGYARR